MEIEIFTLCDYAQDNNGKMVIVGTFDTINSNVYPYVHSSCSVAVRLRFSSKQAGNHSFKFRAINSNGKEIIPSVEGNIQVNLAAEGHHSTINIVLNMGQLKFEKPGKYAIELFIDGEWKSGLPVILNKV